MSACLYATRCPIFSRFEATFSLHVPFFFHNQEERGSTHWGAPQAPPGGDCSDYTLIHPADVLRVMLNYFSLLLTVNPFFSCRRPSENISLEFLRWTSSSEVIVIFKSIYLYDPSKTTADVLLKKSLQKFSYRNHHVMHPRFFGQFG